MRSGTLNSSSGHGAGRTGLGPCQLGNRGLRTASHGGAGSNLLGVQAGGCPQQSGPGRLGRKVGYGRVGEASRGKGAAVSNRRDGERAVWPVVSTKPPIY